MELETTMRNFRDSMTQADIIAVHIVDTVAAKLAEAWANYARSPRHTESEVSQVLEDVANQMAAERVRVLYMAEDSLGRALKAAADAVDAEQPEGDLIHVGELPLVEYDSGTIDVTAQRTWRHVLGLQSATASLTKQFDSALHRPLEEILHRYSNMLDAWLRAKLREMRRTFTTRADLYRASASQDASRASGTPDEIMADLADIDSDREAGAPALHPRLLTWLRHHFQTVDRSVRT